MKVNQSIVHAVRAFIVLAALALVVPMTSAQLLEKPPNRESINIVFGSPGRDMTAVIGSGLPIPADAEYRPLKDSAGREIVWREIRRTTDPRGGVHAFYRQYLQLGGQLAELDGSEVGVHYDRKGRLHVIAGHQFTALAVVNNLLSRHITDAIPQ